ncbi:hypothetical protein ABMA27_001084 [Loxostege sticticalis]|uniref:Uncharacterized protein n=1 Tax=Loxostege sticticalis TaxID=481309 RepID=A0ABR3I1M3_LOXSC
MEDSEQYIRMKTAFYTKMDALIKSKNINHQIFTKDGYLSMIAKVEHAKGLKYGKTPADYSRLKKFDILEIDGVKRLVSPFFCSSTQSGNKTSGGIRMFVYLDEIFDILHATHFKVGHKRRSTMLIEVSQFKNITREMVQVYLNICEFCIEKDASKTKEKEPTISCIDFIEMPRDEHGHYVILLHIDVKTKFVLLKPLKNCDLLEVTRALLDIFTIFGPPDVLQGNTEDKMELLEESKTKITHLLNNWMDSNKTLEWSEGVKFVQYMKNKEYYKILTKSAGEAMFGNRFGRTIKTKRTSEATDQDDADKERDTCSAVGEPSSETVDIQIEEDQAANVAKRIKVEPEPCNSNVIIIQKTEPLGNEDDPETLSPW